MNVASLADVKAQFNDYLEQAEKGPVAITRDGKVVAVLIAPTDDDDLERLLLSRSSQLTSIVAQSHQSIGEGKGLTSDDFWSLVNQE